jgi:dTDP-4-amino-4,6-dideoxygalactose transaminase
LLGATPRFADVRESDMNLDPQRLEDAITSRTRAIVVVHLAGHPADMDSILEIGARHRLPVIEDAAQAVGSRYRGRRTGSMGQAACFSLHPLKNLHAYGDAGVITTNDQQLYEWLMQARNHGLRNRDSSDFWSTNSRIDTLQAAMLIPKLRHLDDWIQERRAIAGEYCEALQDVVSVPRELKDCHHTYQTFMIQAGRRDELLQHLARLGVDAKVHYPAPIHLQPAAAGLGYDAAEFPVATRLASHIVSLPLYPELTREQRAAVIDGVRSFYQ